MEKRRSRTKSSIILLTFFVKKDTQILKKFSTTMPKIECRPKRVGGSIYQVPMDVPAGRQFALASRWILGAARSKDGKDFAHFLAQELIDAATETGTAFKKKLDVYKMAEANKAFARFANNR